MISLLTEIAVRYAGPKNLQEGKTPEAESQTGGGVIALVEDRDLQRCRAVLQHGGECEVCGLYFHEQEVLPFPRHFHAQGPRPHQWQVLHSFPGRLSRFREDKEEWSGLRPSRGDHLNQLQFDHSRKVYHCPWRQEGWSCSLPGIFPHQTAQGLTRRKLQDCLGSFSEPRF